MIALYLIALATVTAAAFHVWERKSRAARRLAQLRQLHQR